MTCLYLYIKEFSIIKKNIDLGCMVAGSGNTLKCHYCQPLWPSSRSLSHSQGQPIPQKGLLAVELRDAVAEDEPCCPPWKAMWFNTVVGTERSAVASEEAGSTVAGVDDGSGFCAGRFGCDNFNLCLGFTAGSTMLSASLAVELRGTVAEDEP